MKVLHVCLAAFYIDHYAYQENILPRMHKIQGHDVSIVASCETFIDNQYLGYVTPSEYVNEDGISVKRLPYKKFLPLSLAKKLRLYEGLGKYLHDVKPDFVFLHDIQFLSIKEIVLYKKEYPQTVIVADGHTDYINSARSFISKNILHRLIYKPSIRRAERYIDKFYGTLPSRNRFMHEMYGIPSEKIEYLPLGVDDTKLNGLEQDSEREYLISQYKLKRDNYIVITGGKFDKAKRNIINLVEAVSGLEDVILIVFGSFSKEIEEIVNSVAKSNIIFVGWLNELECSKMIMGSDLAVFPYLHSTLWEQSAGVGTPLLVTKIEGFTHVNIKDNCRFLNSCSKEEIRENIVKCREENIALRHNASVAKNYFEYSEIARKVIKDNV